MHRLLPLAALAAITPALSAQYVSDFESLTASAAGTLLTGQDGYYLPAVASSVDWNAYTYAGNTMGVVTNPNGGGNNFIAGVAPGTAIGSCRAQHALAFDNLSPWRVEFDVNCLFIGTATPANNIGSVSTQPSTTAAYINGLARWPATLTTTSWDADYVYYDAAGTSVTGSVPDTNFQGLMVNHWYHWATEFDFVSNRMRAVEITDLTTNVTHRWEPTDWYMLGGTAGAPLPTDFRWFASGSAGNVFAIDNAMILPLQYGSYGNGCVGTAGTPNLTALSGTPMLGTTFTAQLSNLPASSLALVTTGFSESSFGAVSLPFDLTPLGAPGCMILVSPDIATLVINSGGTAPWTLAIPNNPALSGLGFLNQGVVFDAGANALGLTTSNARRGFIR